MPFSLKKNYGSEVHFRDTDDSIVVFNTAAETVGTHNSLRNSDF